MDTLIMGLLASVGFLFVVLYIKERLEKVDWRDVAGEAISQVEELKDKIVEKLGD